MELPLFRECFLRLLCGAEGCSAEEEDEEEEDKEEDEEEGEEEEEDSPASFGQTLDREAPLEEDDERRFLLIFSCRLFCFCEAGGW